TPRRHDDPTKIATPMVLILEAKRVRARSDISCLSEFINRLEAYPHKPDMFFRALCRIADRGYPLNVPSRERSAIVSNDKSGRTEVKFQRYLSTGFGRPRVVRVLENFKDGVRRVGPSTHSP